MLFYISKTDNVGQTLWTSSEAEPTGAAGHADVGHAEAPPQADEKADQPSAEEPKAAE